MSQRLVTLPDGRTVPDDSAEAQQYLHGQGSQVPTTSDIAKAVAAGTIANKAVNGIGESLVSKGIASTPAENAAWNAGAMEAGGLEGAAATSPSFFGGSLMEGTGSMGTGTIGAGLAGGALLYDLSQNRKRIGTGAGYLEGAGAGAGIGMAVGGPVGAGIGAGVGLLGNALGFGHKSRTKEEEKHRAALAEQGIVVPNSDVKEWENNAAFKASRKESDLTGKDIIHAAGLYDLSGYANADAATQEAIANEALKNNLIREEHGQIDLSHNQAFDDFVKAQLAKNKETPKAEEGGVPQIKIERDPRAERASKKASIDSLLSNTLPTAPRYDINLSPVYKNPYL